MKQYFRIGPMLVTQANALSGGLLIGMPAMYAYTGWLKGMCLRLSKQGQVSVTPLGVSPILHTFSLHRGHAKYVRYRPGQLAEVAGRGPNHPTVDEQKASFELSVIIAIESKDLEIQTASIAACISGMKISGGGISPVGLKDVHIRVKKIDSITRCFDGLPFNAVTLSDASYVLDDARSAGLDGFDAILQALAAPSGFATAKAGAFERPLWMPKEGRFLPVCVGAIALESFKSPSERQGIRQADNATLEMPTKHAFAESAFTLVRAQTIASVRAQSRLAATSAGQIAEPSVFWKEIPPEPGQLPFYGAHARTVTEI